MYIFQKRGNYDQLSKELEEIELGLRGSSRARGDRVEIEEIENIVVLHRVQQISFFVFKLTRQRSR